MLRRLVRALLAGVLGCACCVLLLVSGVEAGDKPVVYWPYFEFEPLFVLSNKTIGGTGPALQERLLPGVKGFEHRWIYAPPQRSFLLAQQNKTICLVGLLKRAEREAFLIYSGKPCRLAPPLLVAARKGEMDDLATDGAVSLEELLKRPGLTIGLSKDFSYGPAVDALLDRWLDPSRRVTIYSPEYAQESLRMIASGAIDYAMLSAYQIKMTGEQLGLEGKVDAFRLAEAPPHFRGYIACTRNQQGREVIRQVNSALEGFVPSRKHLELFLPYLPESVQGDFIREYRRVYGWSGTLTGE